MDSEAEEPGAVLEWIWQRVGQAVEAGAADQIHVQLEGLRAAADDENLAAAADGAAQLLDLIAALQRES